MTDARGRSWGAGWCLGSLEASWADLVPWLPLEGVLLGEGSMRLWQIALLPPRHKGPFLPPLRGRTDVAELSTNHSTPACRRDVT